MKDTKEMKRKIGWLVLILAMCNMIFTYILAYFPPDSVERADSIISVNVVLVIAMTVIACIYLYNAYDLE